MKILLGISKKSRSIFLELDANAQKSPQISPASPTKTNKDNIRKARDVSRTIFFCHKLKKKKWFSSF